MQNCRQGLVHREHRLQRGTQHTEANLPIGKDRDLSCLSASRSAPRFRWNSLDLPTIDPQVLAQVVRWRVFVVPKVPGWRNKYRDQPRSTPLRLLTASFRHAPCSSRGPSLHRRSLFRRTLSSLPSSLPVSWRRRSTVAPWPLSPRPTASWWRRRLRLCLHDSTSASSWELLPVLLSVRSSSSTQPISCVGRHQCVSGRQRSSFGVFCVSPVPPRRQVRWGRQSARLGARQSWHPAYLSGLPFPKSQRSQSQS